MEIKKLLQKQATLKLAKKIDKHNQAKLKNQQSILLKQKFTRSISSFNNMQILGDSIDRKNSSQRKFRKNTNIYYDPLQSMKNIFVQDPEFTQQQEVISDVNGKFQLCLSLTKQYKQLKLQNFIVCLKKYIGGIIKNLIDIQNDKMKKIINKVKLLSQEYQEKIQNLQNATIQKLKSQKIQNNSELSNKIEVLQFRATFSGLIIQQFCNKYEDFQQKIRKTSLMSNYIKQVYQKRKDIQNQLMRTQQKQSMYKQIQSNYDSKLLTSPYYSLISFKNMNN